MQNVLSTAVQSLCCSLVTIDCGLHDGDVRGPQELDVLGRSRGAEPDLAALIDIQHQGSETLWPQRDVVLLRHMQM